MSRSREIKINNVLYRQTQVVDAGKQNKLVSERLVGPHFIHFKIDKNLDGVMDVWELERGPVRLTYFGFDRNKYRHLKVEVRDKSGIAQREFLLSPDRKKYIQIARKFTKHQILNDEMDGGYCSAQPLTIQATQGNWNEILQRLAKQGEDKARAAVNCQINKLSKFIFDRYCFEDEINETGNLTRRSMVSSFPDIRAGLAEVVLSVARFDHGSEKKHLQCMVNNGFRDKAERIHGRIEWEYLNIKDKINDEQTKKKLADPTNCDPVPVPSYYTLPRAPLISCWHITEKGPNGERSQASYDTYTRSVSIHRTKDEVLKDYGKPGATAKEAYATAFLHELSHDAGIMDEKLAHAIGNCCGKGDQGECEELRDLRYETEKLDAMNRAFWHSHSTFNLFRDKLAKTLGDKATDHFMEEHNKSFTATWEQAQKAYGLCKQESAENGKCGEACVKKCSLAASDKIGADTAKFFDVGGRCEALSGPAHAKNCRAQGLYLISMLCPSSSCGGGGDVLNNRLFSPTRAWAQEPAVAGDSYSCDPGKTYGLGQDRQCRISQLKIGGDILNSTGEWGTAPQLITVPGSGPDAGDDSSKEGNVDNTLGNLDDYNNTPSSEYDGWPESEDDQPKAFAAASDLVESFSSENFLPRAEASGGTDSEFGSHDAGADRGYVASNLGSLSSTDDFIFGPTSTSSPSSSYSPKVTTPEWQMPVPSFTERGSPIVAPSAPSPQVPSSQPVLSSQPSQAGGGPAGGQDGRSGARGANISVGSDNARRVPASEYKLPKFTTGPAFASSSLGPSGARPAEGAGGGLSNPQDKGSSDSPSTAGGRDEDSGTDRSPVTRGRAVRTTKGATKLGEGPAKKPSLSDKSVKIDPKLLAAQDLEAVVEAMNVEALQFMEASKVQEVQAAIVARYKYKTFDSLKQELGGNQLQRFLAAAKVQIRGPKDELYPARNLAAAESGRAIGTPKENVKVKTLCVGKDGKLDVCRRSTKLR